MITVMITTVRNTEDSLHTQQRTMYSQPQLLEESHGQQIKRKPLREFVLFDTSAGMLHTFYHMFLSVYPLFSCNELLHNLVINISLSV
jgi:hypothetical protein